MAYFLLSAQAQTGGKGYLAGWWHLGARDQTWVNLMQGKLFTHCTLALAPVRVFYNPGDYKDVPTDILEIQLV